MIKLLQSNRIGQIIKNIKDNTHKWSINDFQRILDIIIRFRNDNIRFNILYYLLECFYKRDSLSFLDKTNMIMTSLSTLIMYKNNKTIKYILNRKISSNVIRMSYYIILFKYGCPYENIDIIKSVIHNRRIVCAYMLTYTSTFYNTTNKNIIKYILSNLNSYPFFIPTDKKSSFYSEMLLINEMTDPI